MPESGATATVEFLTRENCLLCVEAERQLARWAPRLNLAVDRRDVDADPELREEFGGRVPVLRTAAGVELASGRWSRYRTYVALVSYRLAASRTDFEAGADH